MITRRFRAGDEIALHHVYYTAIHMIASRDYTREQIDAWAPAYPDMEQWINRIKGIRPFVVELNDGIVGYADVQSTGHIDHFFVSGNHSRQGIGTRLMKRIHEEAANLGLTELTSHVSKTAEPFFSLHGFQVVERGFPSLGGVTLQNALMHKGLKTGA